MLRRFCDRCAAEMPMEQTMGDDELILRKINGRPFDLCEECQRSLHKWRISSLDDWYEARRINCDKRNDNAE